MALNLAAVNIGARAFHTSPISNHVIKLTRLRVVDNSPIGKKAMLIGKPPKCIHIYNKKGIGYIGKYQLKKLMFQYYRRQKFVSSKKKKGKKDCL